MSQTLSTHFVNVTMRKLVKLKVPNTKTSVFGAQALRVWWYVLDTAQPEPTNALSYIYFGGLDRAAEACAIGPSDVSKALKGFCSVGLLRYRGMEEHRTYKPSKTYELNVEMITGLVAEDFVETTKVGHSTYPTTTPRRAEGRSQGRAEGESQGRSSLPSEPLSAPISQQNLDPNVNTNHDGEEEMTWNCDQQCEERDELTPLQIAIFEGAFEREVKSKNAPIRHPTAYKAKCRDTYRPILKDITKNLDPEWLKNEGENGLRRLADKAFEASRVAKASQ
jgi:hypothetical protein